MQSSKIQDKGKTIAHVYLCTEYLSSQSKDGVISSLSKSIKKSSVGYAGFTKKEHLEQTLASFIFDRNTMAAAIPRLQFDHKRIQKIIGQSITNCHRAIPSSPTKIFVFPTFSTFVKNKMSGVLGYTPYKNTVLLFINPPGKKWYRALAHTVTHEFNHSIFFRFHQNEIFRDLFIFEGLAEHFREYVVGPGQAPWTKVMSLDQSKKMLLELKPHWYSKNYYDLYQSVFFGNKKYPTWAGYTIGYYVVKSFLKNNKDLDWKRIIRLSPQEIFERSFFL